MEHIWIVPSVQFLKQDPHIFSIFLVLFFFIFIHNLQHTNKLGHIHYSSFIT